MRFVPIPGWLVVLPDTDEERSTGGVQFPDTMRRKRTTGTCILHNPTRWWDCIEPSLEGYHIVIEKWAWKLLPLGDTILYLVPERAVLGVLTTAEGEVAMNRAELIVELRDRVESIVTENVLTNREVTTDELDSIDSELSLDIASQIVADSEADEDKEEEEEKAE